MLQPTRIFISATSRGLHDYRRIATEVVAAQGSVPVVQEHFSTPRDQIVREIRQKVYDSQAILAIVGPYFGHSSGVHGRTGEALSYSQYELEYALRFQRPCLVMIAECALTEPGAESEPDALRESQATFIQQLKVEQPCQCFSNQYEFALALAKHRWTEWLHG